MRQVFFIFEFMKILIFTCFILYSTFLSAHNIDSSGVKYELRYQFSYHDRLMHNQLNVNFNFGNHVLFLGPSYTRIAQPKPIASIIYNPNGFGGNIGYRFHFATLKNKVKFFVQTSFTIFSYSYTEYNNSSSKGMIVNKVWIENAANIGLKYLMSKRFSMDVGFGIAGPGFFLVLENNNPSAFVGVNYRVGK